MELDYLVAFVALVSMLVLALSLLQLPEPSNNLETFLTTVAVAAKHPGTLVRTKLVLPRGSLTLGGNRITLRGAVLPLSAVEIYRRWGLGSAEGNALVLNFTVNRLELREGIYTLEVSSTPGEVRVRVLDYSPPP